MTAEAEGKTIPRIPAGERTDLITIGVACYNIEDYIARCIESLLHQTYDNLEILLIDDGGTDNTRAICEEYAKKDDRIRVIPQENRGLGGARNTAIREAKGTYIAFVDGDDIVDPRMYEALLSALRANEAQIAVCRYLQIKEQAARTVSFFEEHQAKNLWEAPYMIAMDGKEALHALVEENEKIVIQNAGWNKLYPVSLIGELRFPEKKKYEDIVYTPMLLAKAQRVAYVDAPLYGYVVEREGSIMAGGVGRAILTDQIPQYEACIRFLKEHDDALAALYEYNVYKKMLLLYTEARRSRDTKKRACKEDIAAYIRTAGDKMERIYGAKGANPHEKLRMRLFLAHPFLYNCFMDLNEGIVLPLRSRRRAS